MEAREKMVAVLYREMVKKLQKSVKFRSCNSNYVTMNGIFYSMK